jgi:hypothetical protein
VAVIADTHLPRGNRRLPDGCLRRLAEADLILHAGDLVSAAFLAELRSLGPVRAVRGNVDEPALRAVLDERLVVVVADIHIGMVHDPGTARKRETRLIGRFPGCGAIVYGHTHMPQVESRDGVWILNPGSPTERRKAPVRTMLELVVADGHLEPTLIELE